MPRPIAFDLTRLFVGALDSTPRGIDRVDQGFARRLFADDGSPHVGLVPGPFRMGRVEARNARGLAEAVEHLWREGAPAAADTALSSLLRWLDGTDAAQAPALRPPSRTSRKVRQIASMTWYARASLVASSARAVPPGAVYLNTGQVLLGAPWVFGWLDRRPDVRAVAMVYDLIPLRFPEYSGPILSRHHARALDTVARRFSALLAISEASADEVRTSLRRLGRTDMPIKVVPLPVSPSLLAPDTQAPPSAPPYFVTVGILDQRKNHRLLWHVWRDLLRRHGPGIPKLVAIGGRGLRTTELHALLAASPGLADVVRVVSGLPSPAMRRLLSGARALLMPSFAEGFGLPLIEAAAQGVAVVASDIPAHREVAGATGAVLLDPTDGPGWAEAVLRLAAAPAGARPRGPAPAPQTWDSYLGEVLPWLETL